MDPRVAYTLAGIGILIAWFWLDILIDQIEMRRGPRGSWMAGVVVMILLLAGPNATIYGWATAAIGAGLLLNTAYYLYIRQH